MTKYYIWHVYLNSHHNMSVFMTKIIAILPTDKLQNGQRIPLYQDSSSFWQILMVSYITPFVLHYCQPFPISRNTINVLKTLILKNTFLMHDRNIQRQNVFKRIVFVYLDCCEVVFHLPYRIQPTCIITAIICVHMDD